MATTQRQADDDRHGAADAAPDQKSIGEDTKRQPLARPLGQISVADASVLERFDRLEALLNQLVQQRAVKDWYTVQEAAQLLGKAEFTVREWCRLGRIRAEKRRSGRGAFPAWVISHDELARYQHEGLLPGRKPA